MIAISRREEGRSDIAHRNGLSPQHSRWPWTPRAVMSSTVLALLVATGVAHAKDPGSPTAEHLGLTPAYLQGDWCNTHIQFPKERTEENTPFRWDPDGTYATRGSKHGDMTAGYFYLYKPNGQVKLATVAGFFKVKSVKPDAFVLHLFGDMHFQRGPCK
jgi:hypothetical protein